MVVPMLEIALQGEVPTPELRVPLLATVTGGAGCFSAGLVSDVLAADWSIVG